MTDVFTDRRAVLADTGRDYHRHNDQRSLDLIALVDEGVDLEAAIEHLDWTLPGAESALRTRRLRPEIVRECSRLRSAELRARQQADARAGVEYRTSTNRIIRMRIHQLSESRDPESRIRVAELRLLQTALTRKAAS